MIKVERIDRGRVTVLRVTGDVDQEGVSEVRLGLLGCLAERRYNLVVDLSEVGMISYMGLGVFVERLQVVRNCGGDMKIAGLNTYGDHLFRLVGISSLFERYDTEQQAVQVYQEAA